MPVKTKGGVAMRLKCSIFRSANEKMILCQLTDADCAMGRSGSFQDQLVGMFKRGAYGIVFINSVGNVLSANEAFMRLTDVVVAATEILGPSR